MRKLSRALPPRQTAAAVVGGAVVSKRWCGGVMVCCLGGVVWWWLRWYVGVVVVAVVRWCGGGCAHERDPNHNAKLVERAERTAVPMISCHAPQLSSHTESTASHCAAALSCDTAAWHSAGALCWRDLGDVHLHSRRLHRRPTADERLYCVRTYSSTTREGVYGL